MSRTHAHEAPSAAERVAPAASAKQSSLPTTGNQSLARMMAPSTPTIARITMTPKTLGHTGTIGAVKGLVGQSDFNKIRAALSAYHASGSPAQKQLHAQRILKLIQVWMDKHAGGKSSGNQARIAKLKQLGEEIHQELAGPGKGGAPGAQANGTSAEESSQQQGSHEDEADEAGSGEEDVAQPLPVNQGPNNADADFQDRVNVTANNADADFQDRANVTANNGAPPQPQVQGGHESESEEDEHDDAQAQSSPQASQQAQSKGNKALPLAAQFQQLVDAYKRAGKAADKHRILTQLQPLVAQLKATLTGKPAESLAKLEQLFASELPKMAEQAAYMAKLERGQNAFDYLSGLGPVVIQQAKELSEGKTGKADGTGPKTLKLIQKYGLTEAETAAIKIYTVDDYKYINPALAGDRGGWMKSKIGELSGSKSNDATPAGMDKAANEGLEHAKHAVSGLERLPAWTGNVFRGMALSPADFKAQFQDTTTWLAKPFSSTSLDESVSTDFAKREAKGGKVGILLRIKVNNGRDVAQLSYYGGHESEVLLLPGAQAAIDKVKENTLSGGNKWYIVDMTQNK